MGSALAYVGVVIRKTAPLVLNQSTLGSCPCSISRHFCDLMRVKVVHTSLDSSVVLTGKLCSWHSGNSHSEQEHKAALFVTAIVSITFIITEGGVKIAKHAKNRKGKIVK